MTPLRPWRRRSDSRQRMRAGVADDLPARRSGPVGPLREAPWDTTAIRSRSTAIDTVIRLQQRLRDTDPAHADRMTRPAGGSCTAYRRAAGSRPCRAETWGARLAHQHGL